MSSRGVKYVTHTLIIPVSKHNTQHSCWVVIHGKVYDVRDSNALFLRLTNRLKVTNFLEDHPGGAQAILRCAGRDSTEQFELIHPPDTLNDIEAAFLGLCEPPNCLGQPAPSQSAPQIDMHALLNLDEIEDAAKEVISKKAWAYYYSAADDKISKNLNKQAYRSILFRPRVFVDCRTCDLETTLLGYNVGLPIFVSPTAMARLGHPTGEAGIAEGCRPFEVLQIIANNSSLSPEDIVANAPASQIFGWQLYVQLNRKLSEDMLARVNRLDQVKFIVLTLDAPVSGKREDDERVNIQASPAGKYQHSAFRWYRSLDNLV